MSSECKAKKFLGGPAYPVDLGDTVHTGMTLRDYFAAAALTGILVHMRDMTPSLAAVDAFKAADAMLKARQQNGGEA